VREQQEPQVFIHIAGIEARACIQRRRIDEMDDGLRAGQARGVHVEGQRVAAERDRDGLQGGHGRDVEVRAIDLSVQRHEHADVVSCGVQVARERAGDIRQPAGLGQRRGLRSNEADAKRH
jgi:hypothetical protein